MAQPSNLYSDFHNVGGWRVWVDDIVYFCSLLHNLPGASPTLGNLASLPGHQVWGQIPDNIPHFLLSRAHECGGTSPDNSILLLLDGIKHCLIYLQDGLDIGRYRWVLSIF